MVMVPFPWRCSHMQENIGIFSPPSLEGCCPCLATEGSHQPLLCVDNKTFILQRQTPQPLTCFLCLALTPLYAWISLLYTAISLLKQDLAEGIKAMDSPFFSCQVPLNILHSSLFSFHVTPPQCWFPISSFSCGLRLDLVLVRGPQSLWEEAPPPNWPSSNIEYTRSFSALFFSCCFFFSGLITNGPTFCKS